MSTGNKAKAREDEIIELGEPDDVSNLPFVTRAAYDSLQYRLDEKTAEAKDYREALKYYDQAHRLNWTIDFNELPKVAIKALNKYKEEQ